MDTNQLEQLCSKVCALAKETGAFIKEEQKKISPKEIEIKGLNNFVTYVDKEAERRIITKLSEFIGDAGYIAEEGTQTKKGDIYNWIIDPLDGTTNFIHGCPPFAISIALMEHNEIILGVVYEINLDECFYAWKDGPAMLNNSKISVSGNSSMDKAFIVTGFPYTAYDRIDGFMESMRYFFQKSAGVRRLGSAATDLAYVACGRFDAFYEYGLNAWDVAAGILIIQQAGGKIHDFKGGKDYIFGAEIVATNAAIHEDFRIKVAEFLSK